jgi:hypothetical protein
MPWYKSELFETIYQLSLIGTFIFLIWNTTESYRIRKINAAQKDLKLIPALTFYIRGPKDLDEDKLENFRFVIRNLGNGVATSVFIPPIIFTEGDTEFRFDFKLSDKNNTLIAGEERLIDIEVHKNGASDYHNRYEDFYAYFNPNNLESVEVFREAGMISPTTESKRNIPVYFRDIHGQLYNTIIGFHPEGIRIIQPPKRIRA